MVHNQRHELQLTSSNRPAGKMTLCSTLAAPSMASISHLLKRASVGRTSSEYSLQELMPFKAVVVSTGGGAVVRRQNWGFMQHGVVVWLTGSPELLSRRALRDGTATRPLLSQNDGQAKGTARLPAPLL